MKTIENAFLLLALVAMIPCLTGCSDFGTTWNKLTGQEEEEEAPAEAPSILFMHPGQVPTSGGCILSVHGFNFETGSLVIIDGIECPITFKSAIEIDTVAPPHAEGVVDVTVLNPDGQSGTASGSLTYTSGPILTGISPNNGPRTGGTTLTVNGFNFQAGCTVKVGANSATGVSVLSATTVTCTTPAGTLGAQQVLLTNPDTRTATFDSFTYLEPPPVLNTVSPSSGTNMGGTVCTLSGVEFRSGCTVLFGSLSAASVTFVNSTTVTATTPAGPHAAGAVSVTLRNSDGQQSVKASGFTYTFANPAPTVTAISPTSGPNTGGTPVTVTGTGFLTGATLTLGSYSATSVVRVSATQITANTGAAPGITSNTTVNVVVTNPDTQTGTRANAFTYTASGGPGPSGNRVATYTIDTSANCDLWFFDYPAQITRFRNVMIAGGLHTNGASATTDAAVEDWLQAEILGYQSQYYRRNHSGAKVSGTSFNICFVGTTPPSPWIPPPSTQGNKQANQYNRFEFSDTNPSGGGAMGTAYVDSSISGGMPTNGKRENNSRANGLGTFMTVVWNSLASSGRVSVLNPALSASDLNYVNGTYTLGSGTAAQDARFTAIQTRINNFASGLAQVTMHEVGHSVGLVITTRASGGHCTGSTCPMKAVGTWGQTTWCSNCTTELAASLGYSP
jgi:hypothetical protein